MAVLLFLREEPVRDPAPDGMVMLQFPTAEDARARYNSPAYQAALPHRQKGADYRAFIVQGHFGFGLAGILSPVAFGGLVDLTGSWTIPFYGSIVLLLIGAALSYLTYPDRRFSA